MTKRAIIDTILETAGEKIQDEISGFLDRQLALATTRGQLISKADFFSKTTKKQVLAKIAVDGDAEGDIYLFAPLKAAILLGGTLIMLPSSELEGRVKKEEFTDEENDAFGEIANVIAGVYTAVFDDLYPKNLRFKKTGLEVVVPSKVQAESPEPIPPVEFLHSSCSMTMDGQSLGELHVLFPAEMLELNTPKPAPQPPAAESAPEEKEEEPPPAAAPSSAPSERPLVLIVAEKKEEGEAFQKGLEEAGFATKLLTPKEEVKSLFAAGEIRGVFLIMEEVNDQGLASAIQIKSSGGSVPLIAAAPQWTKRTVLQAVKYGICDILVTPAGKEEIREKISLHLSPKQANKK